MRYMMRASAPSLHRDKRQGDEDDQTTKACDQYSQNILLVSLTISPR